MGIVGMVKTNPPWLESYQTKSWRAPHAGNVPYPMRSGVHKFNLRGEEFESHKRYELNIPKGWKLYTLDRDGWQCLRCNKTDDLHCHHYVYRSQGGDHHPDNLITLDGHCHRKVHEGKVWIYVDPEGNVFFGGSRSDLLSR